MLSKFRFWAIRKLIGWDQGMLFRLAKAGQFSPMDWVIAARHVPGYLPKNAPMMEEQWFGNDGFPVPDKKMVGA
jgi:hypothetical protein